MNPHSHDPSHLVGGRQGLVHRIRLALVPQHRAQNGPAAAAAAASVVLGVPGFGGGGGAGHGGAKKVASRDAERLVRGRWWGAFEPLVEARAPNCTWDEAENTPGRAFGCLCLAQRPREAQSWADSAPVVGAGVVRLGSVYIFLHQNQCRFAQENNGVI